MSSAWRTLIDVALDVAEASPADAVAVRALRVAIPKQLIIPVARGEKVRPDNPVNLLWKAASFYVWPERLPYPVRNAKDQTAYRRGAQPELASAARVARAYLNMLEGEGVAS